MSSYQSIFRRYEMKYLLTMEQYEQVRRFSSTHLIPDKFGLTGIISLYYDTPSLSLIRRSLEHPLYKEKLRLRAYGIPKNRDTVYVELKKKYEGVVYKRREAMPLACALKYLAGKGHAPKHTQITDEIESFRRFYNREGGLNPTMTLSYQRQAFCGIDPTEDLRLTFDTDIRYRCSRLNPALGYDGARVVPEDTVLMEIKTGRAIPLWLCQILNEAGIYKTSFSKYGQAYRLSCEGTIPILNAENEKQIETGRLIRCV